MNGDIGLYNSLSLNIDLTLPDYFGRERRIKIQDQMKVIRSFLSDVEKMMNDSSYQEYDETGKAIPYQLSVQALDVPLTNDAKNYNALFKELEHDLGLLNKFRDDNASD